MVQELIVYLILFIAVTYTAYSVVKSLRTKSAGGCSDGCGCSAKDEINKVLKHSRPVIKSEKISI